MNRKMLLGDPPATPVARNDFGRLEGLPAGTSNASSSSAFLRRTTAAKYDAALAVGHGAGASFEDEPRTGTAHLPAGLAGPPDSLSVFSASPGT
ncbi:MAG: hypothetical protein IRZ04_10360 [Rhodospirillales bacterium]|nr:hypothetical protein [Rhodospirillales bacterium]